MSTSQELSLKRIAEIKLFKDTDISDCPELTAEQLKQLKPRYPKSFARKKVVS
ncbi:MAG: hypothetical protein FWC15_08390 [Fibromonadales bacterium]|nr:hypothetical protein [Fibromonadales bacterium]